MIKGREPRREKIKRVKAVRECSELAATLHLKPKGRLKKRRQLLIRSTELMHMLVSVLCAPLSAAHVLARYALDYVCMYVCMCWQAGETSGFHEGQGRRRAAKYSTEGIRGNLLIREKRLNLRSCNCKWRWGLSEELSASLAGVIQAGKPLHFNTQMCVTAPHTHRQTRVCTGIRLLLLALINCIIWTANPSRQCNNNTADKCMSPFYRHCELTVKPWGPETFMLTHAEVTRIQVILSFLKTLFTKVKAFWGISYKKKE